ATATLFPYTTLFRSQRFELLLLQLMPQGLQLSFLLFEQLPCRLRLTRRAWWLSRRRKSDGARRMDMRRKRRGNGDCGGGNRRRRSEEHTSELQSREN